MESKCSGLEVYVTWNKNTEATRKYLKVMLKYSTSVNILSFLQGLTVSWDAQCDFITFTKGESVFSFCFLQVDLFTFNPSVWLDPPIIAGPRLPELDLSRGVEATPVELCPGDGGARPPDFRYRKDRWPHGCFLSSGPTLFRVCCDCTDGCMNAQRCACIATNRDGHHYAYHRLAEPVPSGYDKNNKT